MSEFNQGPSHLALKEITDWTIFVNKHQPMHRIGKRGGNFVDTPSSIKNHVLNIDIQDDLCFLWCLNFFVHNKDDQLSSYPPIEELDLNLKGFTFPLPLKSVSKFEKLNNFSVNVFSISKNTKNLLFLHRTQNYTDKKRLINMILLRDGKKHHYALIINLSALMH